MSSTARKVEPRPKIAAGEFLLENMKERLTIWLDADTVMKVREMATEQGTKYQTLMNKLLREAVMGEESRSKKLDERLESIENKLEQVLKSS